MDIVQMLSNLSDECYLREYNKHIFSKRTKITISNLHADRVETFMTISKCYVQKTQNPHSVRTTKQFDNS